MKNRLGLVCVLGAVVLAGCSSGGDPTYLTADETNAEYIEASADLVLPTGVEFAAPNNPAVADDGNDIFYEAGSGRIDAQYFWYCAWAVDAVASDGAASAVANLEQAEDMEMWDALDYEGRVMFSEQLEAVRDGDVAPLTEFVTLNCAFDELK